MSHDDLINPPELSAAYGRSQAASWHGCPQHFRPATTNTNYWAEKITTNRERDVRAEAALTEAGWAVLRFWEHEDPKEVAATIARTVRGRPTGDGRVTGASP